VLALAIVVVIWVRRDASVLRDYVGLVIYPQGGAMAHVQYRRDGAPSLVSISLDFNGDRKFDETEVVIDAFPAQPQLYWSSNFYFRTHRLSDTGILARVTLVGDAGTEIVERRVVPRILPAPFRVSDFEGIPQPSRSMTARHEQRVIGVPDIEQSNNECAPVSAANTLIALAKRYGEDGRLPADLRVMLDELKRDMRWSLTGGVTVDDFVAGVNRWAASKGLPIATEKIGEGRQALTTLAESLATDDAALIRLSFSLSSGSTRRVLGGHLVTVVGVHDIGGSTFIDIHDPNSPQGVDTYRVENSAIVDYVLFPEATTTLGQGFTQTWTGGTMTLP
jgi:hypothetical protein